MKEDFLSIDDVSNEELAWLLDKGLGYALHKDTETPFSGHVASMIFEKPSLRTKVSFDIACYELGGHTVYLSAQEIGLDVREPVEDVGKVLSSWSSLIIARVNSHSTLERLAKVSTRPVVNALSDYEHPCQAIADMMTIRQNFESMEGLNIAYVGDANNCALSLGLGIGIVVALFGLLSVSLKSTIVRFVNKTDIIGDKIHQVFSLLGNTLIILLGIVFLYLYW